MPSDDELRKALLYALGLGYQLCPDALEALRSLPEGVEPTELLKEVLEALGPSGRSFIRGEDVEEALGRRAPAPVGAPRPIPAREVEADIEVLMDPTGAPAPPGSVEDFLRYFKDRFERLSSLLRMRMDARDASTVAAALRAGQNSEVKMIGMVREKREGDGKLVVVLEDLEATATVVFTPRAGSSAYDTATRLMPDQVVCVRAVKIAGDLFLAKELVGPDVPLARRENTKLDGPLYAVLISDLHYGSRSFLHDLFGRFLSWLKGEVGTRRLRELAGGVKYVVIAGDLVDGVGVYPGQEEELEVKDVVEQYEGVAELLSELPDHIEVIMIPGNHDACRKALPQPAVPKKYAGPLYEDDRFHFFGNPSLIALHGARLLIYHGNSFDDMVSTVPGMAFDRPLEMMRLVLWARHLAPTYGLKTPIAPLAEDLLVVEEVPDVFHTGHIHVAGSGGYKGVLLINSGCWQAQTPYQRARGIRPTPGRAFLVDLHGLGVRELDFTRPELWA